MNLQNIVPLSKLRLTITTIVVLVTTICLILLTNGIHSIDRSELNGEFNTTELYFSPERDLVAMHIDLSVHYELETVDGEQEWSKMIPTGGHLIHIQDDSGVSAYTVTLFHQMKCLDIIRQQYAERLVRNSTPLVTHCMNYLRQTILCRPNKRLESVKNTVGTATRDYDVVCYDWTKVYTEANRNHKEFLSFERNVAVVL